MSTMAVQNTLNQDVVTIESFKELYAFLLASPQTIVMVTRKKRAYNSVARIITSVVGTSYKLVQIHTGKYDFPGVQQEWYMIQDDEIMVLFFKGLRWMQDIDEDYVRDICVRVKEEAELYIYTRRWRPEDNDAKRLVTDDLSLDSMHNSRVSRGVAKSTQNVNAN